MLNWILNYLVMGIVVYLVLCTVCVASWIYVKADWKSCMKTELNKFKTLRGIGGVMLVVVLWPVAIVLAVPGLFIFVRHNKEIEENL